MSFSSGNAARITRFIGQSSEFLTKSMTQKRAQRTVFSKISNNCSLTRVSLFEQKGIRLL